MEFYRQKSKIWELFEKANIHSLIAPFGFSTPYKDYNFQTKCRLICQPEHAEKNKDFNTEIRISPRMHAKLAIGFNGVLFGSFNFSNSKQKEIIVFSNNPKDIEDALSEFDFWWAGAKAMEE